MKDSKKGFTIIEVVVVLAIAGLIFGVVFWALPNLQKSNRDSTRRTVAANILANLDQYAANANGAYPTDLNGFNGFLGNYFTEGIDDPLDGSYLDASNASTSVVFAGNGDHVSDFQSGTVTSVIMYGTSIKCDRSNVGAFTSTGAGGARAIGVAIALEQGVGYCVDNN